MHRKTLASVFSDPIPVSRVCDWLQKSMHVPHSWLKPRARA